MIRRRQFIGGAGAAILLAGPLMARNRTLDVAYVNARVWTGAAAAPRTDAIGLIGNRIAALGAAQVRARSGRKTQVIDLGGAFVMPGFTDSHTHFTRASLALAQVSLHGVNTRDAFAQRIGEAARAVRPGQWVLGGNWDAELWGGELPTRAWIDAAAPEVPVAVHRQDLHMMLLNGAAMRLAGIDRRTSDVPGGVILRDKAGEPTGIVKDAAMALVERVIPPPSEAVVDDAIRKGVALGLSKGVTQICAPDVDWTSHDALRRLRAAGETGIRFYSLVPIQTWERIAALIREEGHGDDWLRWGGVKALADGSLGSRTALFHQPYDDDAHTRGIAVTSEATLRSLIGVVDKAGLQVATHAIGDAANDQVLDIYRDVAGANGKRDRRFRIEHAQHLTPAAIPRFAAQGVIASVQPYHAIDDGRWAIQRIGAERLKGTYAFRSLIASGAHVCFGSDWPVAPLDPLTGVEAAVLRRTIDGANPDGWLPEQKIGVAQALTAYTREASYAAFSDDRMGTLAPGYLADFAVLDADLSAVDPARITAVKVLRTVVDGKQRFGG